MRFRVGDKVRIRYRHALDYAYVNPGVVGVLKSTLSNAPHPYKVIFDSGGEDWLKEDQLELVEETPQQQPSKDLAKAIKSLNDIAKRDNLNITVTIKLGE